MEFIAQQTLRQMLKQRYLVPGRGYFWDALEHLPSYELHGRLSWRRLTAASEAAAQLLRLRRPLVLFTDRIAGWRQVPDRRRRSPIRVGSLAEALTTIRERSRFRDGTTYEDNYYLCDRTVRWFMVFCHHDGWHLWLPKRAVTQRAWRRWQVRTGAGLVAPPRP